MLTDAEWQVMNEVALHRGASPHLNTIDVFVDGQHLTEAVVRALLLPLFLQFFESFAAIFVEAFAKILC